MTDVQLSSAEAELLARIPADGSTISNPAVQAQLDWPDDAYWKVRDDLVDKGLIVRGRGRGGTLRRVIETVPTETIAVPVDLESAPDPLQQVEAAIRREVELYEPMAGVLRGDWARDRRANPLAVEVTALQGRRSTGGTWSRPDLVSVEIKTYAYVPGKILEVVTFEVKPADAIDVQAVYEALAHRRSSTHAYVLLHVPAYAEAQLKETIEDVRQVARTHGVGVISCVDPADYTTWDELEEAQRVEPDPNRLDQFISTQLSEATRNKIARGLR